MTVSTTRNGLVLVVSVIALLAATLVAVVGTAAPAQGAAFTVTRFDDPAPGACMVGDCTLREAMIAANTNGLTDTITLPAGAYTLTYRPAAEVGDLAIFGDLDIAAPLTINGAGSATTSITSTPASGERVFHVTATGTAVINGVTISGGMTDGGAGILGDFGSTITLNDVVVTGNTTSSSGAGVAASGTLTMSRSTISGNSAPAGFAGGLLSGGPSTLTNVTISGNSSLGGGGILLAGAAAMTANGVTVTANTAELGGGMVGFIFTGTATLGASIVAGNTDSDTVTSVDPDCALLTLTSAGYLMVGNSTGGCTITGGTGDQIGTAVAPINPLLGPLAANGSTGPFTHALLSGSPAVNAVPPATCVTQLGASPTDARRVARAQGPNCDIGAFEVRTPIEVVDNYGTPAAKKLTVAAPGVLGNDQNPDAPSMTAAKVTDPGSGTLSLAADGSFTYVPAPGFVGNTSFTYRASNFAGSTNTQTVNLSVTPLGHDVGLVEGGIWSLRDNKNGAVRTITFGTPTDVPIMGNWNCDGVETPGLFRAQKDPADLNLPEGLAYYRNDNAAGVQVGQFRFVLGNPGDIPLAGDFNGDGCDSLSVYRPSEQKFYIADKLPPPIPLNQPLQAFNANKTYVFGVAGDKPFVGDFDGDGIETIGLHRESTGLIYYLNSHPAGASPPADVQYTFGDPGDRLVAGDWVIVDGKFSPALWRSSNATFFFRDDNAVSFKPAAASFPFGTAGSAAIPVSGVMGLS